MSIFSIIVTEKLTKTVNIVGMCCMYLTNPFATNTCTDVPVYTVSLTVPISK